MIPTELQMRLKKRVERIFEGKMFKNPNGNEVPLQVFEQHLPEKTANDENFYPYVIVQLNYGEQKSYNEQHKAPVLFVVGVYFEGNDNQGHKEVMGIINKLFEDFSRFPIEDMRYEIDFPLRWGLHEEDMAPYYFGAVETTWTLPTFQREDLEDHS
ncbi:hypothetical protein HMPREF1013_00838 [Bacillus sp. 2_A_57_CT2]|nr:hypothetical protein HMPREF1013_00838 [Bacillus sp. 2_A_57_CT2]